MKFRRIKKNGCIGTQTDLCMQDIEDLNRNVVKLSKNVALEYDKINDVLQELQSDRRNIIKQKDTHNDAAKGAEQERIGHMAIQIMELENKLRLFFDVNFEKTNTHSRKIRDLHNEIKKQISAHDELKSEMRETKDDLKTEKRRTMKLEDKLDTFELKSEKQIEEMHQKINEIHAQVSRALPIEVMQSEIEFTRKTQLELEAKQKRYDVALTIQADETGRIQGQLEKANLKEQRLEEETGRIREQLQNTDLKVQQFEQITKDGKQLNNTNQGTERNEMKDHLQNGVQKSKEIDMTLPMHEGSLEESAHLYAQETGNVRCMPLWQTFKQLKETDVTLPMHEESLEESAHLYAQETGNETCEGLTEDERKFGEILRELVTNPKTSDDETYVKVVAVQQDPSLEEKYKRQFEDLYNFP